LEEQTQHGRIRIHAASLVDLRAECHCSCARVAENQLVAAEGNLEGSQRELGEGGQGTRVLAPGGSQANRQCRSDWACTSSLTRAVPRQMMPGTPEHSLIRDSVKPHQLDNLEVYLMP